MKEIWKKQTFLFENKELRVKDGYVEKPETHGLGVKITDEIIKKFPYKEKINTMISTNESDIQLI